MAFEDLTHIRERTDASWGHRWAFRTLHEQLEYKPEAVGISVQQVGSAYTSKRCVECGFTAHPDGFEAEFTDKPQPPRANPPG
nr:zinc ribbon domain-containing protein [Haloglomus irregulare]